MQTESPWFQYWRRKPKARIRLFCFPYAGGGASVFRTWAEHVPSEIEICPVQLPGRENRLTETAFAQMPALIETLAAEILPYLDMPYAFFGHSMGSTVSFELTRFLRKIESVKGPIHLLVSGSRAPHIPDPDPPTYHLPEPEFIEELRRLKGTPEEVLRNEELLHLLIPLLRADFSLCETYTYIKEAPLSCPLSAFGGLQDTDVPRHFVAGWRDHTSSSYFKLRFFMGGHFYLHKEQPALLQAIVQELYQAAG